MTYVIAIHITQEIAVNAILTKEEWETMPKDVNRNQYLKRINVLIKDMKGQNNEIRGLLKEIQDVREETIKNV